MDPVTHTHGPVTRPWLCSPDHDVCDHTFSSSDLYLGGPGDFNGWSKSGLVHVWFASVDQTGTVYQTWRTTLVGCQVGWKKRSTLEGDINLFW